MIILFYVFVFLYKRIEKKEGKDFYEFLVYRDVLFDCIKF